MEPDRWSGRDVELVAEPLRAPRGRRLGLLAVNLSVIAVALIGVYVLGSKDEVALPPDTSLPSPSTVEPTVEQLLAIMPASPIDGKQSQRLPVAALPRTDLADGQSVTALGKGFMPGERVGVVLCVAEAALEGVTACDLGTNGGFDHVTYAEASPEGFVDVDVPLRAVIDTPFSGPVDCRSGPERCLVAVGAISDYDRSGGAAIGFAGQPPFPQPVASISAPGAYLPDQVVDVAVTGMMPFRELQIQLCRDTRCATLASGRVSPDGTFRAAVELPWAFTTGDGTVVSCDAGCELRVGYLALPDTTDAPVPTAVPVTFGPLDADPAPTTATPTPATPPTPPTPTVLSPISTADPVPTLPPVVETVATPRPT